MQDTSIELLRAARSRHSTSCYGGDDRFYCFAIIFVLTHMVVYSNIVIPK